MNTLFFDPEFCVDYFKRSSKVDFSYCFLKCADDKLTPYFIKETGITPGKNVGITPYDYKFYYEKGAISKFPLKIYVNNNWNPVTVNWKSKSGRIYGINDDDIDCNDIEFWFEGLDPMLYHQQLYPNEKLPFKFKDLGFELVVVRLNVNATLVFTFKEDVIDPIDIWITKIDNIIQRFVDKPIKIGNEYGVAHNFTRKCIADNKWEYEVDTGSTGVFIYKKLLPLLSKLACFLKIEIE